MKKGVVYLIGAGPGDPGLITLKGKEILESCDALVYDHLASKEFLSWVPSRCKTFYVLLPAYLFRNWLVYRSHTEM